MLVVETGIGQANVARALDWILSKPALDQVPYVPTSLLFAGYAGALSPELRVGDIVMADEVTDMKGASWPTAGPRLALAPRHGNALRIFPGRLLTTDHLAATLEEKQRLGQQYQALAVDMESALFAARCTQAGLPFACVRSISDDLNTRLSPALASLLSAGTVSPWRVLGLLARQPGIVPELWRLARDTKVASETLARALADLL